jgi:hypothetical protein
MENTNITPYVRPFEARDGIRDSRPWNNSFLRLLVQTRCVDELQANLDLCDEALQGLWAVTNSNQVLGFYFRLRGIFAFLRTAVRTARTFVSMGGKRDSGQSRLTNGFPYFERRVEDATQVLRELAIPCANLPREVFARLSSAIGQLESLCLFLRQDSLRKRSKKNRNSELNKALGENEALEEEQGSSSSDEGEPGLLTA